MMIDCVALMSYIQSTERERLASTKLTHEDKIKRTSIDVKCCKHHKNPRQRSLAIRCRPHTCSRHPVNADAPSIAAGAKRPSGGAPV